jgi:hypothetical protein
MSVETFYNELSEYFIKNVEDFEDITTIGDYSSTEKHLVDLKKNIVNQLIGFCNNNDNLSVYKLKVKLE